MKWETYEEITMNIYKALGKQSNVKIEGWGNNFTYKGKTSILHQIDILTSHSDGIHNYLTDIECKYCEKKVNKDIVMKVNSIVEDCNFNKGIIVSKKGFTPDAISYAKYKNVGLVILREFTDEDWEGKIQTIISKTIFCMPVITKFENVFSEILNDVIVNKCIDTNDYKYVLPGGKGKKVIEIINDFQNKFKFDTKELYDEITFPDNTYFEDLVGNKYGKVTKVILSGKLITYSHESVINGKELIWLIMESIFEDKQFSISKEGEIRELSQ